MENTEELVLQVKNITKTFPGVLANEKISIDIRKGEIHGILGENGAGKTTLMKILYGLYYPDSGEIIVNGRHVEIKSPKVAVDLGIGMVHQHFKLIENLSALENVLLGLKQENPPLLHKDKVRKKFLKLAEEYQLNIDPDVLVWQLSVGQQQWLEILKLLFRDVNILILDEPTAVLAPAEADKLFSTMRRLVKEGCSVIFISHKLDEVQQITDRISVLRDGSLVGTIDTKDSTSSKLAMMMVGRPISLGRRLRPPQLTKKTALSIQNLSCSNDRGLTAIDDLDLFVNTGEILGIAGVDGNGQKELAECIVGLRKITKGSISIDGIPVDSVVSDTSILGYVPEERQRTGLFIDFNVAENLVIKSIGSRKFSQKGVIKWDNVRKNALQLIAKYKIKVPNPNVFVSNLSGGNQQKVVLARELNAKPSILVCAQATRGLDLGAVDSLHELLLEERNRGCAVIFISTELSEVMSLSDRIIVMYKGKIMGEVDGENANIETIGEMMLGKKIENNSTLRGIYE